MAILVGGRIKYVAKPGYVAPAEDPKAQAKAVRPKPVKPQKPKFDATYLAAARELRDRYLEQVNDRLLITPRGKYDVARIVGIPEGRRQLGRRSAGPKPMALPDAA